MAPQRYERVRVAFAAGSSLAADNNTDTSLQVAAQEDDDLPIVETELRPHPPSIPSSPPPSFRSRVSSRRGSILHNAPESDVERSLDDAFGGPHESEDESEEPESQRLVSSPEQATPPQPGQLQRRVTEFPGAVNVTSPRVYGGGSGTRDGVFANISAKPSRDDDLEEKPPVCCEGLQILWTRALTQCPDIRASCC